MCEFSLIYHDGDKPKTKKFEKRVKTMHDQKDLRNAGLKATLPRLKILELFEKSDDRHLSAEDVYKVLLNAGDDVGLATVYRVLTQFEDAGLLLRHHFER